MAVTDPSPEIKMKAHNAIMSSISTSILIAYKTGRISQSSKDLYDRKLLPNILLGSLLYSSALALLYIFVLKFTIISCIDMVIAASTIHTHHVLEPIYLIM